MKERLEAPRVLESPLDNLIGGEESRGRKETIGGTPMGTLFCPWKKVLARVGDWSIDLD